MNFNYSCNRLFRREEHLYHIVTVPFFLPSRLSPGQFQSHGSYLQSLWKNRGGHDSQIRDLLLALDTNRAWGSLAWGSASVTPVTSHRSGCAFMSRGAAAHVVMSPRYTVCLVYTISIALILKYPPLLHFGVA